MEELLSVEKQAFLYFVSCLYTAAYELKNDILILANDNLKAKVSKYINKKNWLNFKSKLFRSIKYYGWLQAMR